MCQAIKPAVLDSPSDEGVSMGAGGERARKTSVELSPAILCLVTSGTQSVAVEFA